MAYDEGLLARCLDALQQLSAGPIRDRSTFSMRGLMRGRRMFAAVGEDVLLVKLPPDAYDDALRQPGVAPFAPGGERPMTTWVTVDAAYVADDPQLRDWLRLALRSLD